jgi:hypothetical protein
LIPIIESNLQRDNNNLIPNVIMQPRQNSGCI